VPHGLHDHARMLAVKHERSSESLAQCVQVRPPPLLILIDDSSARQITPEGCLPGRQGLSAGMASIFSTALFLAVLAPKATDVTWLKVPPRATDPQIGETYNSPHYVYVNREIVVERGPQLPRARHQLLLYLTGTGGHWEDAKAFCDLAADLGYHVINLMYPDNIPATVCARDSDPKAFEDFRMAIIQGGQSRYTTIERADSIEKLLMFLRPRRPREDWGQFLNADDAIKWESIAVSGQSQGGGHAALIAIRHRVARVICTGAPKDYSKRPDA